MLFIMPYISPYFIDDALYLAINHFQLVISFGKPLTKIIKRDCIIVHSTKTKLDCIESVGP